jgi:hypothetical protein
MRHLLRRIEATFPGVDHAQAPVCLVPPRCTRIGISLVALLWPLTLGQASAAGSLGARQKEPPPSNAVQTTSTGRVQSGSPDHDARPGSGSHLRPHKRSHAFPKIARDDDPNDDETSDDPNDDVLWDDPTDYDDTGVPIIAWLQEMVPDLDAPDCAPVTWTAHLPSSPFLMLQRLRC